ncbi:hypothetical protein TNCV_4484501 [Trichonephila clavipes]|nr:hypothetical protein TNCV_4484501 [Trichonephila clavipes]
MPCSELKPKPTLSKSDGHIHHADWADDLLYSVTSIYYSFSLKLQMTVTAGSDVVQSGRPIFDDFFQHLWPYIGNNTANVVFQMVKRLWLLRIDQ